MKKILSALAILAVTAGPALSGEPETLIKGSHEHGGFGAPVMKITTVDYEPGWILGVRGGWIIDHKLTVASGIYLLAKNLNNGEGEYSDEADLSFVYGGFELEYTLWSDKLLHGSINSLIGGGTLSLDDSEDDCEGDECVFESNGYFVFEPGVNLELNVTKFFRIALGVGYRVVAGDDFYEFDGTDLSGVTGTLMLKFGKF